MLNEFKKHATIIDINLLIQIGPFNRWITKKIKTICENAENLTLFGCNSVYYYRTIPHLPNSVKCIDLIHAFVHPFEDGPEKWSLPIVSSLSNRVIISQNTKKDFETLYVKNNIDLKYLERVILIQNFVEAKVHIEKDTTGNLNLIYVGRGSDEKRIHLISRAAKIAAQAKIPATFHFVGRVKDAIPTEDLPYCILHGEVTDTNQMDIYYNNSHALLITSSREGFPMVIMEAMMHGVVPIATNVGGISSHVITNENGILIESTDEVEIVNQIITTINYFVANKNEWKKISDNAYTYANTHFSKDAFFQSYKNLLN
jgi:glycosyltransferase involved in cell wall biosynthesis